VFHENVAREEARRREPENLVPPRRKIAPKQGGWSQAQAHHLAPPRASLAKDLIDHRWRIDAEYIRSRKSRAWGAVTGETDYSAMLFVLGSAWAQFERTGGHRCPWDSEPPELV